MSQKDTYQGNMLKLQLLDDGYAELHFDAIKGSVNVFNQATVVELHEALAVLEQQSNIRGLLLTSGKGVFVAGADITEFGDVFKGTDKQRRTFLGAANEAFNKIESLPYPSVGIIPGWGGTVRLPRLIGFDNAVKWIATGSHNKAAAALKEGAVDAVVEPDLLHDEALAMLVRAAEGQLNYQRRREQKQSPLQLNDTELGMSIATSKAMVSSKAGPNYPAPIAAVEVLARSGISGF